mmetsp:Transcript_19324/g.53094  ORF Transcript_19324/g.53094 Transcript_19324/m.53094 type:complete len:227 (-) Transcript_19324:95-775(-)
MIALFLEDVVVFVADDIVVAVVVVVVMIGGPLATIMVTNPTLLLLTTSSSTRGWVRPSSIIVICTLYIHGLRREEFVATQRNSTVALLLIYWCRFSFKSRRTVLRNRPRAAEREDWSRQRLAPLGKSVVVGSDPACCYYCSWPIWASFGGFGSCSGGWIFWFSGETRWWWMVIWRVILLVIWRGIVSSNNNRVARRVSAPAEENRPRTCRPWKGRGLPRTAAFLRA